LHKVASASKNANVETGEDRKGAGRSYTAREARRLEKNGVSEKGWERCGRIERHSSLLSRP